MALPMPMPTAPARQTPRVRTPMFLLGVGLALLAFILMFTFGILFANTAQTGRKVPVVVAAADIQAREPITIATLTLAEIPQTALPPHAFVRPTDLLGYSALVDIYKGQAITSNIVSSNPDQIASPSNSYLPIPQGYIAITLPTGELQGVGGYVSPGDYINVIATANSDLFFNKPSRLLTRTVYTNVRVIRVGPPTLGPKQGQTVGVVASLTVVLSQCDAQFLEWLLTNVTLKYVLLDYHSYDPTALGKPDPTCPSNSTPSAVGPKEVDERWSFTKG